MGNFPIQQIPLILTTPYSRAALLRRRLLVRGFVFLRAVGTEKASVGTRLAVGSDRKALVADLTIGQLTRIWPLLLIYHLIC
jgi:hypothetical protein